MTPDPKDKFTQADLVGHALDVTERLKNEPSAENIEALHGFLVLLRFMIKNGYTEGSYSKGQAEWDRRAS